jgi:hypothetical protein
MDGYYQLAAYMNEVAKHEEVFITVLTGKGVSNPIPLPSPN